MRYGLVAAMISALLAAGLVAGELPATESYDTARAEPRALEGQVIGSDGDPVDGATIRFRPVEPGDRQPSIKPPPSVARTDREGRFSSGDVTGLRFELGVLAEGHAFWTRRDHDPSRPLVVSLERGRALSGRVLDAAGRGLAGVRVTASDSRDFDLPGPEVTTNKEGAYAFAHVAPGTVWVQASARGRATRSVQARVTSGGGTAVADDLWLPGGGSVTGNVVDSRGNPVGGASVWATSVDNAGGAFSVRFPVVQAPSNDDGAFDLRGITAGSRYRIVAEVDDDTRGAAGPFPIDAGTELEDVTIRLHAAALAASTPRRRGTTCTGNRRASPPRGEE